VGRGSTLLLNVPPDRRGLIHENDVKALQKWRAMIDNAFRNNLAADAKTTSTSYRGESGKYGPANATDNDKETYWATDDEVTSADLEIDLGGDRTVNYVVLQEYISWGNASRNLKLNSGKNNAWKRVTRAQPLDIRELLSSIP